MNLIPIVGFSILGLIALRLAYRLGAYGTYKAIRLELEDTNRILVEIGASVGSLGTLLVRLISDLASQPKKTTKTSSRKAAKSLKN